MNFTIDETKCNTSLLLLFFVFGEISLGLVKMAELFLGFIHQSKHEN